MKPGAKVRLTERGKRFFPVAHVKRDVGTITGRHPIDPKVWRVRWEKIKTPDWLHQNLIEPAP